MVIVALSGLLWSATVRSTSSIEHSASPSHGHVSSGLNKQIFVAGCMTRLCVCLRYIKLRLLVFIGKFAHK